MKNARATSPPGPLTGVVCGFVLSPPPQGGREPEKPKTTFARASFLALFAFLTISPVGQAEDVPEPFAAAAGHGVVFRREPGGLRVVTPPAGLTALLGGNRFWQASSEVALGGDFEVAATFDVTTLGLPSPQAEANVELAVLGGADYRPVGINVNANADEGRVFRVIRFGPNRGGFHWNTLAFPRASDKGRIAMRRRGAELIFLAADGAGAPLVELVRYPANPRESPRPRLTAFQGQGPRPTAIDVRLSGTRVSADKVYRGAEIPGPPTPLAAPETYPVTLDYGANPAGLLADFPQGNNAGEFRAGPGGVRVKPPPLPAAKADASAYWARDSRFAVAGDFEVSARFDLSAAGPPGAGITEVGFGLRTDSGVGSVFAGCGVAGREGPRYTVNRENPTRLGPRTDVQRVAAGGRPCRIAVRRTGPELTVTAHEDGQPGPVELVRFPFPPGETPRVRIWSYQHGPPPAAVDALVSELTVKAGRILSSDGAAVADSGGEPVVMGGLPAAPRSRKWRLLGLAAIVAVVGGAAIFVVRSRSNRGKS